MGKFKEIITEEKKNMPDYQYKFLYHRVMPGFIFVLGGAVVVLVLGMILYFITRSEIIPFIPLIIWGLTTIVLYVLFIIYSKKYSKRLLTDKTKEFEKEFKLIEYNKAMEKLEKKKIIINDKLLIGKELYNLDDCNIFFFCKTLSGIYYFRIEIYRKIDNQLLSMLELDNCLCTYFSNKVHLIQNYELFELFLKNKKLFLEYLYKYNNGKKMNKKIKRRKKYEKNSH